MEAYERVIGEAMAGDITLFAREDYGRGVAHRRSSAEGGTPVYEYAPQTWGPREVDQRVVPASGWHNPTVTG